MTDRGAPAPDKLWERENRAIRMSDKFLSEEDLDLANLSWEELLAHWQLWLEQAQATNDLDERLYSHGVFRVEPGWVETRTGVQRAKPHHRGNDQGS